MKRNRIYESRGVRQKAAEPPVFPLWAGISFWNQTYTCNNEIIGAEMDEKRNTKNMGRLKKGIMTECVMVLVLAVLTMGRQEREATETRGDSG